MNINLYPLTDSGRKLESLFFYEEIDEVTLKDSRELLMSELENKSINKNISVLFLVLVEYALRENIYVIFKVSSWS